MQRHGILWHMKDMAREPAEWRSRLNEKEREELALAERMRDVAAENLRRVTQKLKNRMIQQMRREAARADKE